jgi:hypothetical protein
MDGWMDRPIAIVYLCLGNNRFAPERAIPGGVHRDREHFLLLSGYRLMNRIESIVIDFCSSWTARESCSTSTRLV